MFPYLCSRFTINNSSLSHTSQKELITNVYNKFWKELYIVAYRRLQSEQDVEDLLQDLFISLLDGQVVLESEHNLRAFLHKRLKSRIIDFYRKALLKNTFELHESPLTEEASMEQTDTRLLHRELEEIVKREIENMPEKMKEIFLLSREEQLSNEQIAQQLNLSNQTVRNQVSTALKRIRTSVESYQSDALQPSAFNLVVVIATLTLTNR